MTKTLEQSNGRELLLWVLRRRKRFRVTGASMLPALTPGDEVLVDLEAYRDAVPKVGDIALLYHPRMPNQKIVKRITAVFGNGRVFVEGDNPAHSSDSRVWGVLPATLLIGRVTSRFP